MVLDDLPEEAQQRIIDHANEMKKQRMEASAKGSPWSMIDYQGVVILKLMMRIEALEAKSV